MEQIAARKMMRLCCLNYPTCGAVTLGEFADAFGCSAEHVAHLVNEGTIAALDGARQLGGRRALRVPIEEFIWFTLARIAPAGRARFLAALPTALLRELGRDVETALRAAENTGSARA